MYGSHDVAGRSNCSNCVFQDDGLLELGVNYQILRFEGYRLFNVIPIRRTGDILECCVGYFRKV